MTEEETQAFSKALDAALVAIVLKLLDMTFAEVVSKYREVEKDFVATAAADEFLVRETRRRVAEDILCAARSHEQPFEVCNEAWNDLIRLGFSNTYRESLMTWFYADSCLTNQKPEAGIAVVEPLIADFEGRLKKPDVKGASFYRENIEDLRKLLAELIAQRDAASHEG